MRVQTEQLLLFLQKAGKFLFEAFPSQAGIEGSELSFKEKFLHFDFLSSDVIIGVAVSLILSPHSETSLPGFS